MITTLIICGITCLLMIAAILFFPKIRIGRLTVGTYWIVTLFGAVVLLLSGQGSLSQVTSALTADTAINPIKILVLFISMTALSIYCDELGFFFYLANKTLSFAGRSQKKLFIYLYITVSVLTVFTSNDIIILSFTPFICYFAKNARIDPIPYLAAEFVAANTWSMALIIGNPTNIYLATAYGVDFASYARVMILPTLLAGSVAFGMLYILFYKRLSKPVSGKAVDAYIQDKPLLAVGLFHLAAATLLLAIGSYINLEMWKIALYAVLSLFVCATVISLIRKKPPQVVSGVLRRAPYELIPFIISMFAMIVILESKGVTSYVADALGERLIALKYGAASFLTANVVNNIPMSVFFCSVTENIRSAASQQALFATIAGSNLGALFTPVGALAGIMWSGILSQHNLKYGYLDFLKTGIAVAVPSLLACILIISLIV